MAQNQHDGSLAAHDDSVNTSQRQRIGWCITCGKNEIETIHLECRHLHCCVKCIDTCRECSIPGCKLEHPNHVQFHLGVLPENDNAPVSNDAQDFERVFGTKDDDDPGNAILDNKMNDKQIPKTNTTNGSQPSYDFGDCPICMGNPANYIPVSYNGDLEYLCGHCICSGCYSELKQQEGEKHCPYCSRIIRMCLPV